MIKKIDKILKWKSLSLKERGGGGYISGQIMLKNSKFNCWLSPSLSPWLSLLHAETIGWIWCWERIGKCMWIRSVRISVDGFIWTHATILAAAGWGVICITFARLAFQLPLKRKC